ncbi:hypothetical protein Holit_00178 [Hollandina sp. SP2]
MSEIIDTHFMRSVRFYDTMEHGFGWEVNLSIYYYPASQKQLAFFMRIGYGAIINLVGNTASSPIGIDDGTMDEGYQAKMENRSTTVSLGIILSINP